MSLNHVRCRKCRTRHKLKKRPELYHLLPRCRNCGARDMVWDKWMNERNLKDKTCHADCLPFPHRMGCADCKFLANGEYRHGPVPDLPGSDEEFPF